MKIKLLFFSIACILFIQNISAQRYGRTTVVRRPGSVTAVHSGPVYRPAYHPAYHPVYHPAYRPPVVVHRGPIYRPPVVVHYGFYNPYWYRPFGYTVAAIATTAVVVNMVENSENSDQQVYYDNGIYYVKENGHYKVIPAPTGAQVKTIPDGFTKLTLNDTVYFYDGGVYYIQKDSKYIVVAAPVGLIIPYLPTDGVSKKQVNSKTYFVFNKDYYVEVENDGKKQYKVVNNPNNSIDKQSSTSVKVPDYYEKVSLNNQLYYFYIGVFYKIVDGSLKKIEAPIGATVKSLPKNIKSKKNNGNTYYVYNDVYYLKLDKDNYMVVNKPS